MQAFNNDENIKEQFVNRIMGKPYDRSSYPIVLGIPEMFAYLEDEIFSGLPYAKAMIWPDRFLRAIPVGADLSMIAPKFLLSVIRRGQNELSEKDKKIAGPAIAKAIEFLTDWIESGEPNKDMGTAAVELAKDAWWEVFEARCETGKWDTVKWPTPISCILTSARLATMVGIGSDQMALANSAQAAALSAWWACKDIAAEPAAFAAWMTEYEWMADELINVIETTQWNER